VEAYPGDKPRKIKQPQITQSIKAGGKIMQQKTKISILQGFPSALLFLTGFLVGMLLPNLLWKFQWRQQTVASFYLLGRFAQQDQTGMGMEYFLQVLKQRGTVFLVCALCGISVFGAPLAVIVMLGMGLQVGAILTMSILQFGAAGAVAGLGLLLPQYLIYLPVMMYFLAEVFAQSSKIWQGGGVFSEKLSPYGVRVLLSGAAFVGGILLESYVNPLVVEYVMKILQFF
jgi:stage II sporulation protein M